MRPNGIPLQIIMNSLAEQYQNDCLPLFGSGTPTNGTSGTGAGVNGHGGRSCKYYDTLNGEEYINIGTHDSPYWDMVSSAVTVSSG